MAQKADAVFTISLSSPATQVSSVTYSSLDSTAIAGTHYTAVSGTVTFQLGQSSKTVTVQVNKPADGAPERVFLLRATAVSGNLQIVDAEGICTIPGSNTGELPYNDTGFAYFDRFDWLYRTLKATASGYFGPPTGENAFRVPYHSMEKLIAEAPDWGHATVSETASFWGLLEAWRIGMVGEKTGLETCWTAVETFYIPSATNQPVGTYTPNAPAQYTPEGDNVTDYPIAGQESYPVGVDPLANTLEGAYGNKRMYLMHWYYDVDGVYGFHNGDATTQIVAINSYQRGPQEGLWDTITHASWEDFNQQHPSGKNQYGFLPLFNNSTAKQWRYTCAPDAEVRLIAATHLAYLHATEFNVSIATVTPKAKKMADYLRYCLYDKYFKQGAGIDGTGKHNLISWYVSWGGAIPATGQSSEWGFRIGSSEIHWGYNGVDVAYICATSGENFGPTTSGAATQWQDSLSRQLELIRWLQSPEGPIAGGVSNSWKGRYETPTDGRQTARFYGMYYTYSPVWHDPPSNHWVGFQAWGLERVSRLYMMVAAKTGSFNTDIRTKCGVILDKFIPWLLLNSSFVEGNPYWEIPTELRWGNKNAAVSGQTTTVANSEGYYENLPTLNWNSSGDYAAFWNASGVPNPNLHCTIQYKGTDLGTAACFARLCIQYVKAKLMAGGTLNGIIPNSSYTYQNVLDYAKKILDRIWVDFKDAKGFAAQESRSDYARYDDVVYIPTGYSGRMPNGDIIAPGKKFYELRSFVTQETEWATVQYYLGQESPDWHNFLYHRFWHEVEIAAAFAAMHKYFADVIYA